MCEGPQLTTLPTSPNAQIIFAHMSMTHLITVAIQGTAQNTPTVCELAQKLGRP